MDKFKPVGISISESEQVNCIFFEHEEESILKIKLSGICNYGSQGFNYGEYLYQKIGLALLVHQPIAVLIDLQELKYEYGDRILRVFQVFSELKYLGNDEIITSFILSDLNKFGLASLLQFDINNPSSPLFYDLNLGYKKLFEKYDKI